MNIEGDSILNHIYKSKHSPIFFYIDEGFRMMGLI